MTNSYYYYYVLLLSLLLLLPSWELTYLEGMIIINRKFAWRGKGKTEDREKLDAGC